MGALTLHIRSTITDREQFRTAHEAAVEALADSDVATVHTAYLSEDGTEVYFIDEHDSTDTLMAFADLMADAGEGLPPGRDVVDFAVIGDPDETAARMLDGFPFPKTVYRPLRGS